MLFRSAQCSGFRMKDFHFLSSNRALFTGLVIFTCLCSFSSSLDDGHFDHIASDSENTAVSLIQPEGGDGRAACPVSLICFKSECDLLRSKNLCIMH